MLEIQPTNLIDCANFYYSLLLIYFLAFYVVLHYIKITFSMNIFLFLGCVPLAHRILGDLENNTA